MINNNAIINTDEDPSLRTESFAIINKLKTPKKFQ